MLISSTNGKGHAALGYQSPEEFERQGQSRSAAPEPQPVVGHRISGGCSGTSPEGRERVA
jgi:hypothetical protein